MHNLDNILTELTFILIHFFVFLINYAISGKKLFCPPVLFSLLWTGVLSLHLAFGLSILGELYPIGLETYLVFLIGVLSFSLASFIVTVYNRQHETKIVLPPSQDFKKSLKLRLIFVGIIVVGLPLYIQASIRVFLASQIDDFFQGLRTELVYGDEDMGPTKYLISLSFVIFAINYYALLKERNNLNKFLVFICFVCTMTYSILATGRTYFFAIFTIYLGITHFHKKSFSLKKIVIPVVIFLALFIFGGIFYGKGGNIQNSVKDNLQSSSETLGIYLVSSVSALDHEMSHSINEDNSGGNTLHFFVKIGQQLNLIPKNKAVGKLPEFVFVPYATNVFTFYNPYIRDSGKIYAWLMIALFGGLHTFLYYRTLKTKSLRNTLYYSFLLFPLFMTFFQDQYMLLFSFWIQIIFYIEGYLILELIFFRPQKSDAAMINPQ